MSFEQLDIWKDGCRLAVDVYMVLQNCHEYGIRDQMQRAAVSIPSNIAEGSERKSEKDFIHFLNIANGSCAELRTQLYIAVKAGIIKKENALPLIETAKRLSRQMQSLINKLSSK